MAYYTEFAITSHLNHLLISTIHYVIPTSFTVCQFGHVLGSPSSKKIRIAQNKIFRCIFYLNKFESTRNLIHTQHFLTFTNIRKYFVLLSIYKYLTQYCGAHPFSLVSTSYNIRGNNVDLISLQYRTTLFKHSVLYTGPQMWNLLPLQIKTLQYSGNLSIFKKTMKTYLYTCQNT